jgi:nicotinamide mononucleotide transporter PnuC
MYGIISFGFRYYGEMITYVGMSLPMAIFALVSWLRNPFEKGKTQVRVNRISRGEVVFMLLLSFIVTVAFYFILEHFNTANLIPSTLSITTSFIAAYLTFRRSPYFAFAYAINDVILIVLWTLATIKDISYLSVLVCFVVFLFNDTYGFTRWKIMQKRQEKTNPLK